ncbi:MAG: tetratricopeptide repeat protein [Acidobacteriaceae bacterium]|nr:tetratricopeptide repeat protein [Acidobacteriaceae bacterium]
MTRAVCLACFAVFALAAIGFSQSATQDRQQTNQPPVAKTPPAQNPPDEAMPPEEDESVAPEKFTLNPLESDRNIRVGNFYWHKGKYRAALERYERATKFNPSSAEAFFKVGETEEKLNDKDAAKIAFQKVIQLAPDSKFARDARKKLKT